MSYKLVLAAVLCLFLMPAAASVPKGMQATIPHLTSICSVQEAQMNGPALQENRLYCPASNSFFSFTSSTNMDTLAPSTYQEALLLASRKHIIVGTPLSVIQTFDWAKCPITYVEFSSGFHAEHHNVGNACKPDLTVRYYDQYDRQVWP